MSDNKGPGMRRTEVTECVFCQIVAGKSPASIFYEDDAVLGFMTIKPVTRGHALVIPKRHAAYLADLGEETGRHLWTITQRTAAAIRKSGLPCEGINLFLADGEAAGQEVFHLHMHVWARYAGDPFGFAIDWGMPPSREELDRAAQQIRPAYD